MKEISHVFTRRPISNFHLPEFSFQISQNLQRWFSQNLFHCLHLIYFCQLLFFFLDLYRSHFWIIWFCYIIKLHVLWHNWLGVDSSTNAQWEPIVCQYCHIYFFQGRYLCPNVINSPSVCLGIHPFVTITADHFPFRWQVSGKQEFCSWVFNALQVILGGNLININYISIIFCDKLMF